MVLFPPQSKSCICKHNKVIWKVNDEETCQCPSGTCYDYEKKECIAESTCQVPTCEGGSSWGSCGSHCVCNLGEETPLDCVNTTIPGCYCPQGQYWKVDMCVDISTCHETCPDGLTYQDVGYECECSKSGELNCTEINVPGCYCSPDSYLENDVCVPRSGCESVCETGKQYKESEGEVCKCVGGEMQCEMTGPAGCYCSDSEKYLNEYDECVPKICERSKYNKNFVIIITIILY